MAEDIIEVNELDFHYNVLEYSFQTPVVVDFWAEWCSPCKYLTPILERLALEAQGAFRLAKINVDQNSNLAIRMGIHSIPNVKGIKNGQVIAEFVGIQPETRIREFIQSLTPHPAELWIEKGEHFLTHKDYSGAEQAFQQALEILPDSPRALLGLIKSLFKLGRIQEAEKYLASFPPSKEYSSAELLLVLAKETLDYINHPTTPQDDIEIAYYHSLSLFIKGNIYAALDGFLDILRQDKYYKNGKLKSLILGLLELLGESDPENRNYRQELASILF